MDKDEWVELVGTVDEIIYANEENGYTVLSLETDGGETVTVTGCLPFASPGEQLIVRGLWVRHPAHGRQFQAEIAERRMPAGAKAIYEYLASRVIKGVGPATASAIVTAFGDRALEVMETIRKSWPGSRASASRRPMRSARRCRSSWDCGG